jgi:glycosyltransferase involved in cell wall biosynthesis
VKILLVHNRYQQPGGEDVVFEQERSLLDRAGHQVVVYQRSNREIENYSALQRLGLAKRIVWASDTRKEFAQLLARERPQLVHVHNTFMLVSPAIYSVCREFNIPVVQTLHNYRLLCPAASFFRDGRICEECMEHTVWRGLWHGCYRDSRAATGAVALMLALHRQWGTWRDSVHSYIALSEFARGRFVSGGFPADKIFVKPNFVHPDPGAGNGDRPHALFVGRLSPEKGPRTLLEGWRLLSTPVPLRIVGDGPERAELERDAQRWQLPNISFEGRLNREQTLAAMRGARFLVVPSVWYESFPMSIAEAFACATPLICSRVGSVQEIVADNASGLHFVPGDPEDLARKIEWAWSHPEKMCEMGREARREYEARYTAEKNQQQLMEIYDHAMSHHA